MLSRVANNIYWTARYIERAENTARIINVNTHLLLDLPKNKTFGWQPLIFIMGSDALFYKQYQEPNEHNVIQFLLADTKNSSSILSSLGQARENLRTTRDIMAVEAWEQLNDLYLFVKNKVNSAKVKQNRYDFLKQIILSSQQLNGIITGTMSRNAAYNFLRMGSYLERADMTTRILDVRSANLLSTDEESNINLTPFYNIQWMSVLKSLTAYQMYRQHMRLRVKGADVLKFILQDTSFPRSIFYCLRAVENRLTCLSTQSDMALRSLARLQRQLQAADVYKLAHEGLREFIDDLQIGLGTVHDNITASYFAMDRGTNAA
ncbi:MAG: hypothetical protein BWK79_19060 [Beggiatoa sp. IS2]|nr:MAG: hypothetical protein BWK79_19060 [Beggiatoa sp. IS2]